MVPLIAKPECIPHDTRKVNEVSPKISSSFWRSQIKLIFSVHTSPHGPKTSQRGRSVYRCRQLGRQGPDGVIGLGKGGPQARDTGTALL